MPHRHARVFVCFFWGSRLGGSRGVPVLVPAQSYSVLNSFGRARAFVVKFLSPSATPFWERDRERQQAKEGSTPPQPVPAATSAAAPPAAPPAAAAAPAGTSARKAIADDMMRLPHWRGIRARCHPARLRTTRTMGLSKQPEAASQRPRVLSALQRFGWIARFVMLAVPLLTLKDNLHSRCAAISDDREENTSRAVRWSVRG